MVCVSHLKGQLHLIGDFVARLLANGLKAALHLCELRSLITNNSQVMSCALLCIRTKHSFKMNQSEGCNHTANVGHIVKSQCWQTQRTVVMETHHGQSRYELVCDPRLHSR